MSIAIGPASSTILQGALQQFAATGTYSDGSTNDLTTQATWASSLGAVATIDTNGLATAVSAGTTVISATLAGVTNSASLTVQPILTSIAVMPVNSTNLVGSSQHFTAIGIYSDGSTNDLTFQAAWVSSNTAVATIETNGLDIAVAAGTTLISAALDGVSGGASLTVIDPVTSPQLLSASMANGVFQFVFTNAPGAVFTIWSTTNLGLPVTQWSSLGPPAEIAPGQYQFSDPQATNYPQQFYRLSHP
jgi:hypothetical protein